MAKTGKLILCQRFNQTISSAFPSVTFDNPKSWQPLNLRNPWSRGSPVEQRFPRSSIEIQGRFATESGCAQYLFERRWRERFVYRPAAAAGLGCFWAAFFDGDTSAHS